MLWRRKQKGDAVRARVRMGPLDGEQVVVARGEDVVALPRPTPAGRRATVDYRLSRSRSGDYVLNYLEEQRVDDPAA